MKAKSFSKILFIFASIVLVACSNTPEVKSIPTSDTNVEENKPKEILAENKSEVEMEIEGMVCAMGCAKYIQDEVSGMNGIAASIVNFEEGKASFEFDKTVLSKEQIATFINEIHDGQYKANIISSENTNDNKDEEETEEKETEESIASVVEQFNFSFPELLTYFMKRL